jgi:hypothetical protein
MRRMASRRIALGIVASLALQLGPGLVETADALRRRESEEVEVVVRRPAREPLMAIVSLGKQRVTIYDAEGSILHARISSGRRGYETPVGIYSILQKEEEHYSNLYDDAEMPFMQRLTWSGIALHAGALPGYPASHGCIRIPYDFAQQLYDLTTIGTRVIVARNDVRPVAIEHPLLFTPAAPRPAPEVVVAAKTAEAQAAARKANAARLAAARLGREAERIVPAAELAKRRAEEQLGFAERLRAAATTPTEAHGAEDAYLRARARLAEAEERLAEAEAQAPLKVEAAASSRQDAIAAEAEKIAALDAARDANRRTSPISVFISRKTARLYVRQAFREVLESPITIRDADEPTGTHVYTALGATTDGTRLHWNVVSLTGPSDIGRGSRAGGENEDSAVVTTSPASAALSRIEIPPESTDLIAALIGPGASLIVSDEALSAETGKDTDFVVVVSGEAHGALEKRRPASQARNRDEAFDDRPTRRSSPNRVPFYWADPYNRW